MKLCGILLCSPTYVSLYQHMVERSHNVPVVQLSR